MAYKEQFQLTDSQVTMISLLDEECVVLVRCRLFGSYVFHYRAPAALFSLVMENIAVQCIQSVVSALGV